MIAYRNSMLLHSIAQGTQNHVFGFEKDKLSNGAGKTLNYLNLQPDLSMIYSKLQEDAQRGRLKPIPREYTVLEGNMALSEYPQNIKRETLEESSVDQETYLTKRTSIGSHSDDQVEDDYHHIYSGRLRNKPNQKFYHKQAKRAGKSSTGDQEDNSPNRIFDKEQNLNENTIIDFKAHDHKSLEPENKTEVVIADKFRKRDYEGYVMVLSTNDMNSPGVKMTSIGNDHQAKIPLLQPEKKIKKTKKYRDLKSIWNPEEIEVETLEDYIHALDEYIGVPSNNLEKAIKLYRKFKNSKAKVLESIRKNRAYYMGYLGIDVKKEKTENLV
jgi:hypothetical protein